MDLRPYQIEAVDWIASRARCLLADQPGLGKTAQLLHAHAKFLAREKDAGLVVVAPKSVKSVWQSEPRKWGFDWPVTILTSGDQWRWPEPGEVVVLNPALLPWTPAQVKQARAMGKKHGPAIEAPDLPVHLILDECQAYRKNKSLQHVRARALSKKCAKVTGATGTPIGGRPFDLYYMLQTLQCCPWSWFQFLRGFNAYELPHGGYDFKRDDDGNAVVEPSIRRDLRRVMLRRLRRDVVADLPPKLYREVDTDHKRATIAELDRLAVECAPYFDADELPPFAEFAHVRKLIAAERIPLIKPAQEFREDLGQIGLIFSAHLDPVLAAGSRPGWGAIHGAVPESERARLIDDFEAGKLRGLAIVIKTAATGISLPSADYEIFVDRSWDPDENEQAEDRANRMDRSKGPIEIEIWASAHPVSRHVARVLARKRALGAAVLGE